jgi:uncharacterized protein (TIGR02217 family)
MSLETFPDDLAAETTGGPMFFTDVAVLQSGHESRNANWFQARWKGELRLSAKEMDTKGRRLLAFFRAVGGGMANVFRVRDWSDYNVIGEEGVFIATDSTGGSLQAYKRYSFGTSLVAYHERKITRPRATPTVIGGAGTWDIDTGILTVTSGAPTNWTGIFDVPARFDTDHMQWHTVGRNSRGVIIEWESVPMIEVRE